MSVEQKTDWQVYVVVCGLGDATPRDVARKVKMPVGRVLASLRRLAEDGLVRPGGVLDGRSVVRPIAWRERYDEAQMANMFCLKPGDLCIKGDS